MSRKRLAARWAARRFAAGRLQGPDGAELLGMAREAFTHAFELVALVCAGLAVIAAIGAEESGAVSAAGG